jgi:hypothetical protein
MSVESTLVGRSSRSISKPSSIFSKICKIRRRLNISETCETSLYNSLDGRCSTYRRKYYKSAEVHLDSLDKGKDLYKMGQKTCNFCLQRTKALFTRPYAEMCTSFKIIDLKNPIYSRVLCNLPLIV